MRFRIKSKLVIAMIFLFGIIVMLGILGVYYINRLSSDSDNILKDNYNSILYCNEMLRGLDNIPNEKSATDDFESNLQRQENNVTEPGEKELTAQVRSNFEKIKQNPSDTTFYNDVRKPLYQIHELNTIAIQKKNDKAQKTAHSAIFWLSLVSGIIFLLTFSFIVNFPGYIANPIRTLTEAIREIANKNYTQRINFKSNDEFGELAHAFNSMAKKLDEYEHSNLAKIMFEKRRIETIITQMHDAIIGLDEKKRILFINPVAETLLGLRDSDIQNKYAPDVALKNDLMRNLLNPKISKDLKIFMGGKESFFTKEYFEVKNEENIIGQVIILKDVTPFKELDVAKTNFIAVISHELKTPISSIKMSLKLLEDQRIGQLNNEQQQLTQNISEDSERLLKIVSELLNMTQAETGKMQLNIQPTDTKEIIEYAIEASRFQAEQKKISIEMNCPDDLPKMNADMDKTAWVLGNLISNAIHYSSENSKIVINAEGKAHFIEVSVMDFGPGIDPKYKDRIFDRYFRVPGGKKEGTGLGLAICKEFVEAQGGKIWMESTLGGGTTFFMRMKA